MFVTKIKHAIRLIVQNVKFTVCQVRITLKAVEIVLCMNLIHSRIEKRIKFGIEL